MTSLAQLTATQVEQLRLCGIGYDGEELPPEQRVTGKGAADEESGVLNFCTLWDVVVDGSLAYEAWFYQVDSGSFFKTGTTEEVAEVIQFGLECGEDLEEILGAGMVKARLLPRGDSKYERFLALLDGSRSE
ncbi:hypothetical protein ACF064_32570 [Streptomyces sp. NPDC015492]|uniref:hypothetical protein n=1 Tax=Streptomyces sp. NPDC015492 TaxID=3364958 RepID=UPI0036F82F4C